MRIVLASLAALSTASPAFSQNCADRDHIIQRLQENYGEELAFGGLQKTRGTQKLMEVYISRETGSFTIIVTTPNGISCIVAVGTDFFEAIPKIEEGNPL